MIICNSRKYIFIHIPKTAGSALSRALEPTLDPKRDFLLTETPHAREKWNFGKHKMKMRGITKHASLADLSRVYDEKLLRSFQVFTLIRNPFDRTVSYYEWLRSFPAKRYGEWGKLAHQMDFKGFILSPKFTETFSRSNFSSYVRFQGGEEYCQAYFKFETLDENFAKLTEAMKLPKTELPHVNASKRAPYQEYYDEESRAHIETICAYDLKRFDYQF